MLSRRRFLVAAAGAALSAILAACSAAIRSLTPSATEAPTPTASPSPTETATVVPSPSPAGPTLRERIAQMLLVGFRGLTIEEAAPTRRLIESGELGGVLLFSVDQPTGGPRNVDSPEQVASLVAALRGAAPATPLLVAVDQEGGLVARLGPSHGFPATPSAADMGAGTPEQTRSTARAMARTLAAAGITLNLAPVVDLAVNPDNPIIAGLGRSFSADPDTVIAHATAFIEAHHESRIACAAKHFPGQGSASGDTHLGVVDVTDAWTEQELTPFAAMADGPLADAILTAHIFNARLDAEHPATLSAPTVTGILRERLRYDGVVISDDLQMGAITQVYGYPEAVRLAIEAGIDVLLVANQIVYDPDVATRTIDLVEGLVRDGRISEARIQASYERILRLKA
jgi:beta-N-acetylhexosaminidase